MADKLESLVWTQIECVLDDPGLIIGEIERQRKDANSLGILETEQRHIERQLKAVDRDQAQLLEWAIKGFPEDLVEAQNNKLNARRGSLKAQKQELEQRIKASQEAAITMPKLKQFVELIRERLANLDFETKRMAIEALDIKVWIDGQNVEFTGVIPITDTVLATPQTA